LKEITTSQNEIPQCFENTDFGEMRVITMDNEPWFIAKDVCDILELNNVSQALSRLDEDEKNTIILNDGIGNPNKLAVNESGLYSLIMSSRKHEAKRFKKWVTSEILPAILKTGKYQAQKPLSTAEHLLQKAKINFERHKRQRSINDKMNLLQDSLDKLAQLEIEYDRRRLVQYVKEYATAKGLQYSQAWTEFVKFYNNAYNTNLNALKTHLMKKLDQTKMTIPEYLKITDHLDDAIRVVEKMLNQGMDQLISC